MNSKAKGELSEGIILAHLLKKGYSVSLPFGNNQRYDLVVDDGQKLLRAQCKTGRFVNGCISFNACSVNGFTHKTSHYEGQVDIFLVYYPVTDKVYQVPIDKVGVKEMRLRIDPTNGGSVSNINWAKDYEI